MKTKHDGDCWIFASNGVCTCGILHRISINPDSKEYKNNQEQIFKHEENLHKLNNLERE